MSKKKFSEMISGKGYYIALILGAAAIGVSGYLYYANQAEDVSASDQDPSALVSAIQADGTAGTQQTEPTTTPGENSKPVKPQKRVKPVDGETVVSHALDMLCYNQTTRDWRTHNGIDIAAAAGTEVCAVADGTVYTVYEDETMGMTVVIHHGQDYVTTYSSLEETLAVQPGDIVTAGQTIGTVGNTALMECAIGDHLHFAVSCRGESMDPAEFLAD